MQIDYFKMNSFLEQMFRGVDVTGQGWGDTYKLPNEFYTDAENPYVDIRLYPTDNWKDVISGHMRKGGVKDSIALDDGHPHAKRIFFFHTAVTDRRDHPPAPRYN